MQKKEPNQNESLHNVIYGGIATEAMNTFATGPFLIAYALMFNAGNIAIGFLGSIVYVGSLMHLFAAYLLNKKYSPRKMSIVSSLISRQCYLIAAVLAFFNNSSYALPLLLICFSLTYLCGGIAGGAWYPWMKYIIPQKILGKFFSLRMKYMMIAQMVCSLFGAVLIYYIDKNYPQQSIFAYSFLLSLSFLVGMYSVYTFTRVYDIKVVIKENIPFYKKLYASFKNEKIRNLTYFMSLLNFSTCFATPFFTAFMLKYLSFSTTSVILLTVLSQLSYILSSRYWGMVADRKDYKTTLTLGLSVFSICILLFILSIYTSFILSCVLLIVANILIGFSGFSVKLTLNNLPLRHVSEEDAATFISVINVCKSFAAVISGICAGGILSLFEKISFSRWFEGAGENCFEWTLFWIVAIFLCLITLLRSKKYA